jgi:transcription elongation factor GreA
MEFTIVGSTEADPFEGRISNESEVGKNLLGKQKGDTVQIVVPDGLLTYKVLDITK